jgi:hypothetical protein
MLMRMGGLLGVLLCMGLFALPAVAGNNSGQAFSHWPDTGQTKCYNNTVEIPCPAAGQPFHGQDAQYAGPARSYTDLGSGMIRDNVTGLIWEQKTNKNNVKNYSDPHDADNTYTWCDTNSNTNGGNAGTCGTNDTMDFLVTLNNTNYGGHNDWRLPTIKELATLVNLGRYDPAIDPVFAATTQLLSRYWSSTTYTGYSGDARHVHFDDGDVGYGGKSHSYYVRAVRGGQ